MAKDFWGTTLPKQTKAPARNPYNQIQSAIPKISKKRKICVRCAVKWVIEYDPSKPLMEYILCPDCRRDIVQ